MSEGAQTVRGRVLSTVGGTYQVDVDGDTLDCALRGRLKQRRGLGRVAVGDEVDIELLPDGDCAITQVRPRHSRLSRRRGHGRREQVIAANVDQLAAVFSVTEPAPHFGLLDRLLVLAEANEIAAFLVVNKIDLSSVKSAREEFSAYDQAGYEAIYTSAETGEGIDTLAERLAERITALVGPSGAGKSSLLNALQPDLGLRVGEISQALQAGKHTTVNAALHRLEIGGFVVDTPGLNRVDFAAVAGERLDACFPEFRPHLGNCKFADCTHLPEPDCAVKEAMEAGEIAEQRYETYRALFEERAAEERY